jgi:hypothetical protein
MACTYCYNLIGVNTFRRSFAEVVLNQLLNGRYTRRTTHEDDLVNIRCESFAS